MSQMSNSFFTGRLDKTIMDRMKASTLSTKIHNAVDEYLTQRDLPSFTSVLNRKRPHHDIDPNTLDGVPMTKKSKPENDSGNGNAPSAPTPMTPAQIKAMMANTMKQIEERKASIASMQNKAGLGSNATKVSLPPPKLVNVVDPPALNAMESIAALQARISAKMEKMVSF